MLHSNTPPVKKQAPLTAQSSTLRCVLAAEHHTARQYFKMHSPEHNHNNISYKDAVYHQLLARSFSRYQDFKKKLFILLFYFSFFYFVKIH